MDQPLRRRDLFLLPLVLACPPLAAALPDTRTTHAHYRIDVAIAPFGFTVFSRKAVGFGTARLSVQNSDGRQTIAFEFGAASLPERTRGIFQIGCFEEVLIQAGSSLLSSRYFGFISSAPDAAPNRATLNRLANSKNPTQYCCAVEGRLLEGQASFTQTYEAPLPGGLNFSTLRQLMRHRLASICETACLRVTRLANPAKTFLSVLAEATLGPANRIQTAYQYGDTVLRFDSSRQEPPPLLIHLPGYSTPFLAPENRLHPKKLAALVVRSYPAACTLKGDSLTQSHLYHASRQALPANLDVAVSLHSHTSRSRETMSFIPRYVGNIPFVTAQIHHLQAKYLEHHGTPFNYSRVWWTPPLEPKAAFDLERNHIEHSLHRKALVSLSDHDCVDAGYALEIFAECAGSPISTEWTVPLGQSFLHIGVHNIQPARARMLHSAMAEVTAQPTFQSIYEMLDELQRDPHTLIVLNHPLWDEARFGTAFHLNMLTRFLDQHGHQIHALELNGLRPLAENLQIARLSKERKIPLVSGGDRHGCEPNAILNLTAAQSFNHFAAELRDGAPTHNVFMPQYDEPLRLRVLQLMSDVLRTYDSLDFNRRRWSDRIFYLCEDETIRRLSDVWMGNGPSLIGIFVAAMRLVESRRIRAALRFALFD